jgi:hypothetical protein
MSNTHIANLENSQSDVQTDPNTPTPTNPVVDFATGAEIVREIKAAFRNGDVVLVKWEDARALTGAPWDVESKGDLPTVSGLSIGAVYDLPEVNEIVVLPHVPGEPLGTDKDYDIGEVVIPYSTIRCIRVLFSPSSYFDRDGQRSSMASGSKAVSADTPTEAISANG